MTEFLSRNLRIPHIADNQEDKESRFNAACAQFDSAITGTLPLTADSSNAMTLTAAQFAGYAVFKFTDDSPPPSDNFIVTLPNIPRGFFAVINDLASQNIYLQADGELAVDVGVASGETGIFFLHNV